MLTQHRRLAVADNSYVVAYTVPLLLGICLLSAPSGRSAWVWPRWPRPAT